MASMTPAIAALLYSSHGFESGHDTVHAIAKAGGSRTITKHPTNMATAMDAVDFRAINPKLVSLVCAAARARGRQKLGQTIWLSYFVELRSRMRPMRRPKVTESPSRSRGFELLAL